MESVKLPCMCHLGVQTVCNHYLCISNQAYNSGEKGFHSISTFLYLTISLEVLSLLLSLDILLLAVYNFYVTVSSLYSFSKTQKAFLQHFLMKIRKRDTLSVQFFSFFSQIAGVLASLELISKFSLCPGSYFHGIP